MIRISRLRLSLIIAFIIVQSLFLYVTLIELRNVAISGILWFLSLLFLFAAFALREKERKKTLSKQVIYFYAF